MYNLFDANRFTLLFKSVLFSVFKPDNYQSVIIILKDVDHIC